MNLTPSQLSSLNEMEIPVWALRSNTTEVETVDSNTQLELRDCIVLVDSNSNDQQEQRLLVAMLHSINVKTEQFTVLNPEQLPQLQTIDQHPTLLLVLGESLAQSLWGKSVIRGQQHQTLQESISTVVSFRLDEILASPAHKALAWDDLLLAKRVLNAK